jgi:hypothetical protein
MKKGGKRDNSLWLSVSYLPYFILFLKKYKKEKKKKRKEKKRKTGIILTISSSKVRR